MPGIGQREKYDWVNKEEGVAMIDRMFAFMRDTPAMAATLARYSATKTATGYEATVFYNSAE